MHPVLFWIPRMPAWVAAAAVALVGAIFLVMAFRDREDRGSWWLAAGCGVGAAAVLGFFGLDGHLGPLPIRFFGLLVVGGFLAGMKVASARNSRLGLLTPEETFDLAFAVLLAGIAGARLLHVAQNMKEFAGQAHKVFAVWDGGLVWYGGAVTAALYAWWSLAKRNRPLWPVSDSLALGVILGQAVGRVGCFLAGCDYGRVIPGGRDAVPWAVNFPVVSDDIPTLVPARFSRDFQGNPVFLHPTQLYLVVMDLAVFALLWLADRRGGKRAFPGRLVCLYLVLYSVGRGVVEHWRGDRDRGVYDLGGLELSFSQIVSAGVLVAGLLLYRHLRAKAPDRGAPAAG